MRPFWGPALRLCFAFSALNALGVAIAGTSCSSLGGNSSCGDGTYNCTHSAEVSGDCNSGLTLTVTYKTVCNLPLPPGGTLEVKNVATRLKTETLAVTNRCGCSLTPSLSRTWGDICDEGACCSCFDLTCN
jgi:hypothetical protein